MDKISNINAKENESTTENSKENIEVVIEPVLTIDNMNPYIKIAPYGVKGIVLLKLIEIEKELAQGTKKPFKEIIRANVGDCQATGQAPITFLRQVLALICYPRLFDDVTIPSDAKFRASEILKNIRGNSIGAYTDSDGIKIVREHVAQYIETRDGGIPSDPNNIFLTGGATEAIKTMLKIINCDIDGKKTGVMIPIPWYPLYTATIVEYDMEIIGYFLNEEKNWSIEVDELKRAYSQVVNICNPRVLVVINPGNPTSQVLSRENIEYVIKFAYLNRLFVFADEVYQHNIYVDGVEFYSFKRIMMELGPPYNRLQLASFMSTSKSYYGECGVRGGYIEVVNLFPDVRAMLSKHLSTHLCPPVTGQAAIDIIVKPPQPGEPSYEQFIQEKTKILDSLKLRARMMEKAFNSIEGYKCTPIMGALYAYPKFDIPHKAIEAAKRIDQQPDTFYAFKLIEQTGICIVPGSGFGQKLGTYHFRTTILPPPNQLKEMLHNLKKFHKSFMAQYGCNCKRTHIKHDTEK